MEALEQDNGDVFFLAANSDQRIPLLIMTRLKCFVTDKTYFDKHNDERFWPVLWGLRAWVYILSKSTATVLASRNPKFEI